MVHYIRNHFHVTYVAMHSLLHVAGILCPCYLALSYLYARVLKQHVSRGTNLNFKKSKQVRSHKGKKPANNSVTCLYDDSVEMKLVATKRFRGKDNAYL